MQHPARSSKLFRLWPTAVDRSRLSSNPSTLNPQPSTLVIYNAVVLRGNWSGVEWAVWNRAVELAAESAPGKFKCLIPRGTRLPDGLTPGHIVWLPKWTACRLGRIVFEIFWLPSFVRKLISEFAGSGNSEIRNKTLNSQPSTLNSEVTIGIKAENIEFIAPAYVAPPRLPCKYTLYLYDLHVYTHPQYCTWTNRVHYRMRMPQSIRRAAKIEVPTEHVLDSLKKFFPEAVSKTDVKPLAIRHVFYRRGIEEICAVRDKYNLPKQYLLFVGDQSPRKNLSALIDAAGQLNICLVIAGEPGRYSKSPHKNVKCTGYVPENDLPALYSGAIAFVYPSFDEGYGLPIAEASACSCPVVTSAPTAHEIAPDAIVCGTTTADIIGAVRHHCHLGSCLVQS